MIDSVAISWWSPAKAVGKVEPHLVTEHRPRAGASPVVLRLPVSSASRIRSRYWRMANHSGSRRPQRLELQGGPRLQPHRTFTPSPLAPVGRVARRDRRQGRQVHVDGERADRAEQAEDDRVPGETRRHGRSLHGIAGGRTWGDHDDGTQPIAPRRGTLQASPGNFLRC